jgi:hypothetical protein
MRHQDVAKPLTHPLAGAFRKSFGCLHTRESISMISVQDASEQTNERGMSLVHLPPIVMRLCE